MITIKRRYRIDAEEVATKYQKKHQNAKDIFIEYDEDGSIRGEMKRRFK